MLKCPQCGALHPVKINKINGLPRKNQNSFCSDACWHKHNRASGKVKPRVSTYRPRSQKPASYHCCMFCGKESMKRLDKDDPNKFCSLACSFESIKRVTREAEALRRIGVNYDKSKFSIQFGFVKLLKKLRDQKARVDTDRRLSDLTCHMCGTAIPYQGNGVPRSFCSDVCRDSAPDNKASRKASKAKRRAAKINRTVLWEAELTALVWKEAAGLVSMRRRSTGINWHADHMIPMGAKEASGLHVWNNCQVIPAKVNTDKRNKLVLIDRGEWLSLM